MHLKRNIGATKVPMSGISPTTPPPIPTEPMVESAPVTPLPSPPKASSPFTNVPVEKSSKLAALEASGSHAFVVVSSPTVCGVLMLYGPLFTFPFCGYTHYVQSAITFSCQVGSFRKGRTVKGKKQPPICKEVSVHENILSVSNFYVANKCKTHHLGYQISIGSS